MKTVTKEKFIKILKRFYESNEKGGIVLPVTHLGVERWYFTKRKNCIMDFIWDQPLIKDVVVNKNLSKDDVTGIVNKYQSSKENRAIGYLIRFIPASLDSKDTLTSKYNILPYIIKDIDEIEKDISKLFNLDDDRKRVYHGPFHKNEKLEEFQCCYFNITEEEFDKDVNEFRKNNNNYFTKFDELEFMINC